MLSYPRPLVLSESVADRAGLRKESPSILNISPVIIKSPRAGHRAGHKAGQDLRSADGILQSSGDQSLQPG